MRNAVVLLAVVIGAACSGSVSPMEQEYLRAFNYRESRSSLYDHRNEYPQDPKWGYQFWRNDERWRAWSHRVDGLPALGTVVRAMISWTTPQQGEKSEPIISLYDLDGNVFSLWCREDDDGAEALAKKLMAQHSKKIVAPNEIPEMYLLKGTGGLLVTYIGPY